MTLHTHICMRCGETFFCLVPAQCKAEERVLPRVAVPGPNGPQIFEHVCYPKGCWDDDALSHMARAALQSLPRIGSMEAAHKVVAAVIVAQDDLSPPKGCTSGELMGGKPT